MLKDWEFEGKISADGESALYKSKPGTRRSIAYVWFNKQVKLHNNLGPAFLNSRSKVWYVNGKKHRLDGPAEIVDRVYGRGPTWETYYIDDKQYSKEDFDKKIKEMGALKKAGEPYGLDLGDLQEGNGGWPEEIDIYKFTGKVSPDGESGLYKYENEIRWFNKQLHLHNKFDFAVERPNGTKYWFVNGVLGREDGPAFENASGYKDWYIDGVRYSKEEYDAKIALKKAGEPYGVDLNDLQEGNEDWPKVVDFTGGYIQTGRSAGRSVKVDFTGEISPDGQSGKYKRGMDVLWLNKQGDLHYNFGSAYDGLTGYKLWYVNGKLHRLDGPAVITFTGVEDYYINGVHYSKEDYDKKIKEIKALQQAGEPYGVDLNDLMEGTNDGWPPDFYGIKYTGEVSSDGESKEIKDYLGTYWINKQGEYHNNEQPAMQYNNGDFYWIVNGAYHNLNGPSVVEKNPPVRSYHINGKEYSKEDFDKKVQQIKDLQQAGAPYGVDLNDL